MSCREELLDLCDQLEIISTSHQLNMLISEIRSGEQWEQQLYIFLKVMIMGDVVSWPIIT